MSAWRRSTGIVRRRWGDAGSFGARTRRTQNGIALYLVSTYNYVGRKRGTADLGERK
jgi:hypothetical protein